MKKILFILLFSSPLFADEDLATELIGQAQTYNYWGEFFNMLLMLGFILVLIFASVWFLKKVMRSRVQNLNRGNGIKILERRPLTPKASLYLVDILGKGVVISESPSGIQMITEFSDETDISSLLEQGQEISPPRVSFREMFTNKLKKLTSKHAR